MLMRDMAAEREFLTRLLFDMVRIRRVQERIESEYLKDQMQTPVHLYIGQEAVATGVCAALERQDYVSSNHRGHGHYLAKGGSLKAMIAELHCRETGCSKGRGGSMHLVDVSVGHMGSSAIVGGGIPVGTGLALASWMKSDGRVSIIFFGDGAADEGVLYESLNFAMLKKLPAVFVLENNGYSVCSKVEARQAGDNPFHGLGADRLPSAIVDGNDVLEVHRHAAAFVDRARAGKGPSFLECRTYRMLGHAGCAAQDMSGYRDASEVERWVGRCPVAAFRDRLLAEGVVDAQVLEGMERDIAAEIDDAFAYSQDCSFPDSDGLHRYLYRE